MVYRTYRQSFTSPVAQRVSTRRGPLTILTVVKGLIT